MRTSRIDSPRPCARAALAACRGLLLAAAATLSCNAAAGAAEHRLWVEQMKLQPRGPFSAIRWYCKDGQRIDPQVGDCGAHGGGVQHGQWSARTLELRANGYLVGNLLATLEPTLADGADAPGLRQLLVERFLVGYDDGWIFRGGRSYRGALQDDDERAGGRRLLLGLVGREASPFLLDREAARLLPHDPEAPLLGAVRAQSAALDARDPRFHALRSRIHNAPELGDAARVRTYAAGVGDPALRAAYTQLASTIEQAFRPPPVPQALARIAALARDPVLKAGLGQWTVPGPAGDEAQMRAAAQASAWLRDNLDALGAPAVRLAALDASLYAEAAVVIAGTRLLPTLVQASRHQRLQWLDSTAIALYGAGLLSARELQSHRAAIAALPRETVGLAEYRHALEYLDRLAGWSSRRLEFELGDGIARLLPLEPLAALYAADRLRGSPLLFHSQVLQSLRDDADRLARVEHSLFGAAPAGRMKRLNPGLARGVLRISTAAPGAGPAIFVVAATASDLPPAAGILTLDEGNPLSHVQLLARNLGIPNVVVARALLPQLQTRDGRRVVIAASRGGRVQLADDGPAWDRMFGVAGGQAGALIVADLTKLDLARVGFISTDDLRAHDSGRIVGPKAAQVGELGHRFPQMASPGLAVPFGVYREVLRQPVRSGATLSMFDWMQREYAQMAVRQQLDPEQDLARRQGFLALVRAWFERQALAPEVRRRLFDAMHDRFGMSGTYGVFVRSDTNVEDLPGFTGAGLNLTVPNVVRFDDVVDALQKVWASPFTGRAYGWRQGLMDRPEHVYVSVLLHRSVANDKSGVMITADIDSGDPAWLTIVTSPGVGGGVDGEAAETLRVNAGSGAVQLLGSATARSRRVLLSQGGARMVPSDAPESVLQPSEIAQLVALAKSLPAQYPELLDGEGALAPADIEFGFAGGQLVLLQIRPFLQNRAAASHHYLAQLDRGLVEAGAQSIDLRQAPAGSAP